MDQTQQTREDMDTTMESSNLFQFFYKWRKALFVLCLIAAVVSSIASLLIENKYQSSVVMYATPQNSFGEQLLEAVKTEDLLEYGEKEDAERLLQILESDVIRLNIIDKYDLWKVYEIDPSDKGANTKMFNEYKSNVSAKLTRFGSIRVDVLDADPKRAMNIANDISALADTVSNKLKSERATDAFYYAEQTYNNLLDEIKTLEDSMVVLRSYGVFDYLTQIESLNDKYATSIVEGRKESAASLKAEMEHLSQFGSAYTKLETLIESAYETQAILRKRYELMKIDKDSQLSAKFIVDYAIASDRKAYPVRWFIVLMSVVSVFFFSVLVILIYENMERLKTTDKI